MPELAGQTLPEVKEPHVFVCHVCNGKLLKIVRHEDQTLSQESGYARLANYGWYI